MENYSENRLALARPAQLKRKKKYSGGMGKAEFSLLGEMEKFKVKDNEVAKGNGEGFEEVRSKQSPGRQGHSGARIYAYVGFLGVPIWPVGVCVYPPHPPSGFVLFLCPVYVIADISF